MKDIIENITLLVGNLFIFGVCAYAVFWQGHSGWWLAFPLIFHFSKTKL